MKLIFGLVLASLLGDSLILGTEISGENALESFACIPEAVSGQVNLTWLGGFVSTDEELFFVDKDGKKYQNCKIDNLGKFGPFTKFGECSHSAESIDAGENIVIRYLLKTAAKPVQNVAISRTAGGLEFTFGCKYSSITRYADSFKMAGIEVGATIVASDPVETNLAGVLSIIGAFEKSSSGGSNSYSYIGGENIFTAGTEVEVV